MKPKVASSPIVRRARRSSASKGSLQPLTASLHLNMKKSQSMDSVPSAESQKAGQHSQVLSDGIQDQQSELRFDELVKIIDKNGDENLSASYSTLPQSFSRGKNISRSLVPKMRKFFEKSKSCDPELPQVKIRIQREGTDRLDLPADGTESTRSSFVLLGPGEREENRVSPATNSVSSSCLTLEEGSETDRARQIKSKGFVNKCVVKVKSLIGRSQELE